jgi:hypothetical protein
MLIIIMNSHGIRKNSGITKHESTRFILGTLRNIIKSLLYTIYWNSDDYFQAVYFTNKIIL